MKYHVTGADSETGDVMEMTIEAANEAAAQDIANRKGIMVSRVAPVIAQPPAPVYAPRPSQPLEQGHLRGAPTINIAPARRGSSFGVASLVLGIIAFVICWIPLVNLLGVPLSALGLLLGLVGLLVAFTRRGASIGYPIAGCAICGLALFIAISVTGALVGGLKKAGDELVKESERRNATNQTTVAAVPVTGVSGPAPSRSDPTGTPPKATEPTPSIEPPSKPAKPEVEWASAETPVKQGDVQIQVKAAKVGLVPLKERIGDDAGTSKDVLLRIELEITNLSETKKLDYRTWGGRTASFGTRTSLLDNFGNKYKSVNFGFSTKVVGAVESESVYPGKAINDVIVFEEPIGKAEHLNLELPAEQFGGTGMLRIRIPASMIQH